LTHHFKISKEAKTCGDFTQIELSVKLGQKGSTSGLKLGEYSSVLEKCKDMGGNRVRLRMCPYEWTKGDGILNEGVFDFFMDGKSYIDLYYGESNDKSPYIEVLKKKKKEFVAKVEEYKPLEDSFDFDASDCFLTTICVNHKGLDDDCFELNFLRHFRDEYVANTANGEQLIEAYYEMGPRIVKHINTHSHKAQILDAMYQDLIMPVIGQLKAGQQEAAKDYYVDYTLQLADACGLTKE